MSQQPQLQPPTPLDGKKKLFDGLTSWQKVLAALPFALVLVGGLIGGLAGFAGASANVWIAKTALPTPLKAAAMLGMTLVAGAAYLVVAGLFANAVNG